MKNAIRVGVVTVLAFFGGIGTWVSLAPLDGAVIGSGSLSVSGNRKTVQHREGGIVAELMVQEGNVVRQGQVLIRLDDTQASAMLAVHRSQWLADMAMTARDEAELAGAETIRFPAELSENDPVAMTMMNRERIVFASHRMLLQRQLEVIDQRAEQTRHQESGARQQFESLRKQLAFAETEQRAVAELERSGLASKNRLLELNRSVEALRGQAGQLSSDVARFASQAVELDAEKLRLRQSSLSEATHELREAQLRINDTLPRMVADRDQLARLEIRAPTGGQVVNLAIFTKGGVVEAGKPLLDLVPVEPGIVAEAEIRPEDIEHLRIGQKAEIVAVGFNSRETLPIEGEVRVISADKINDPRTGHSYFKIEVALVADRQDGKLLARLGPGMPVEVVVPVAPRTTLEYLVAPLMQNMRGAMREL